MAERYLKVGTFLPINSTLTNSEFGSRSLYQYFKNGLLLSAGQIEPLFQGNFSHVLQSSMDCDDIPTSACYTLASYIVHYEIDPINPNLS